MLSRADGAGSAQLDLVKAQEEPLTRRACFPLASSQRTGKLTEELKRVVGLLCLARIIQCLLPSLHEAVSKNLTSPHQVQPYGIQPVQQLTLTYDPHG